MSTHRVASIMRSDVPMLAPDTPIRHAITVLLDARAAAAPVIGVDGGLVGILTQKDCFRPALHASYHQEWTGRVADQMSADVISVDASDDMIRVAEMFLTHPYRVFPVMDGATVVGLVNRSDVLSFLLRAG
ncbi:CBS domain-containing protein [Aliiroseovarius sp. F47248L]|uniref:CBS domain-containing protein n=1 Tax=Aliiroseovarius sp. F47248L TaxID=2926420 RepID=UPI001FF44F7B|nr:CBS domain-containing protein [Aliiroseovarius sp. F47248L]MCK0140632.1 CBS domain-containing protein [Aliiroseovarius sp. F47248L]